MKTMTIEGTLFELVIVFVKENRAPSDTDGCRTYVYFVVSRRQHPTLVVCVLASMRTCKIRCYPTTKLFFDAPQH